MNKSELADAVAQQADISKASATRVVDAVFEQIAARLAQGEAVSIAGFGVFSVKARAARTGRNPQTGEPMQIAASNAPGFKAGKALKDIVN